MKTHRLLCLIFIIPIFSAYSFAQLKTDVKDTQFLTWDVKSALAINESWRVKGRVGGFFDTRMFDTNNSYNYKLRAILMSPEAIRAAARVEQIRSRLTDDETKKLVAEAEQENLIIIIEIDPREGSGVIPNDWRAFIGSRNSNANELIRGDNKSSLRNNKALQSVSKRDYDYDMFWISFPLIDKNGSPVWKVVPSELELVVGINAKEGTVVWKVTDELKLRIENLLKLKSQKSK
ncbi:MAG: hypothetical protein WKF90_10225 [Pyrinomonadaceae bacterium]